jgi:signal transduction histidine kinase/ligand-binding sensor domain-containing protein
MAQARQGASATSASAAAQGGRRLSRIVLISAFVVLSCVQATQAWATVPSPTPPVFQTIADARAVPNGVITALAEDTDGLIWVGSTNGLLRFDGQRVLHESDRSPALPRAFVQSLHASADGRLWVGLQGFGVWWRDPATGAFVRLSPLETPSTHPDSGLTPLAITSDGERGAWIADARDGARRIDAEGRWVDGVHLMPGESVRTVLVDRQGTLWLGHRGGLMRLGTGKTAPEPVPGFEGRYVYAIHEARDGRLWVGTQAHGASVVERDGSVRHLPVAPAPGGVGHPWVDGFVDWGEGRMWLSTFGGGLEVRDATSGALIERLRQSPGRVGSLGVDRIQSILVDRADQLWIATWGGGLQRLPSGLQALRYLPSGPGGLRHPTINASAPLPDGRVWLAVGDLGIDEVDTRSLRVRRAISVGESLADGTVRSLLRTPDGQFWAAMQEGGVWRAADDAGRFEPVAEDWPERRTRTLGVAVAGGVWVGLERGLRRIGTDGEAAPLELREDGQAFDELVWAVLEDDGARLWVGTPLGLWWRPASGGGLRPARASKGGATPVLGVGAASGVLRLAQGPDGTLWMLARDGLYRLRPSPDGVEFERQIEATTVPQGLGDQLVVDRDGVVWTGRVRFDPRARRWQALGPADGLDVANQVWGASRALGDGQIVFGTSTGLVLLDPSRFRPWAFNPQVVLGTVEADGVALPREPWGWRVPAGTRRLAIGFSGLDYSDPAAVRYRYRLEGQSGGWIAADASQPTATFGGLWPGDYVLVVEATNRVGDWSPHALVLPLRVEAKFWQTPAFLLAALLLLLLAIAGLLRWREALAAKRALRLQALVDLRTAELVQARDDAEAALQELRGTQGKLVEAEKMASLGQMVAGVAHELNTPLGNALVVSSTLHEQAQGVARAVEEGRLKRSDLDGFLRVLGEGSQLVVRSIGRAHELVSSFKQVAVDRSGSKRRRFDLGTVVREALEMEGPILRHARFRVALDVPDGIAMDSYPGAISQIVGNMVNNAAMHAFDEDAEGTLRIEAVRIGKAEGTEVVLSFADDGRGMDEAVRRKVFEPFFTTKMGRGGTGLGLNIVYNLVGQLLAGSISVESRPGEGTRFELRLPLVAPSSEPDAGR